MLIGWGKYDYLVELQTPLNDVARMSGALADANVGAFDELVCFDHGEKADEILANLEETLISKVQPHDHVLIYFSGHGKLDKAGRLYLALKSTKPQTLDATSIAIQRVRNYLEQSPCQSAVLILDCCYSGAIGGLFAKGDELNLSELAQARGFVVLTSSTQFQESFEAPAENNSLFTKFLLDGIETGNADTNNDGIITVDEAFTYAANLARGLAVQTPTKFGIDVRGDMFLAKNRNFAPIPKIDFSQIPPTEMVKYVVVDQMVNALQRGDEVGYFVALVGYWIEGIPYPASGLTVNVTSTMNPRLTEQAFEGDVFFSPNMLYPITVEKNGVVKKEFNGNETDVVRVRVRVYFKDIIVISLYHQEQQIDLVQDSAAASRLITFHQMQQSFLEQWTATNSLPNEREFYKLV